MFCSRKALLAAFAGAIVAIGPASAQLYFRPFAYTYSYDYPTPLEDEGPAPYASRRAVASILAREGYRLVGPLSHRGQQIVATGRSQRDGEMRFIVDPYEGRIIRGSPRSPLPELDRGPRGEGEYVEPLGGSRPVVRELDRDDDDEPRAQRSRRDGRSERLREAPEREGITLDRPKERAAAPRRITPEAPQTDRHSNPPANPALTAAPSKPEPVQSKAPEVKSKQAREDAKPANAKPANDKSANDKPASDKPAADKPAESEMAKPAARVVSPGPNHEPAATTAPAKPAPNTSVVAKPAPAAATPPSAPMPKTAANAGGASHRAIVPPTTGPASSASTNKSN